MRRRRRCSRSRSRCIARGWRTVRRPSPRRRRCRPIRSPPAAACAAIAAPTDPEFNSRNSGYASTANASVPRDEQWPPADPVRQRRERKDQHDRHHTRHRDGDECAGLGEVQCLDEIGWQIGEDDVVADVEDDHDPDHLKDRPPCRLHAPRAVARWRLRPTRPAASNAGVSVSRSRMYRPTSPSGPAMRNGMRQP